MKNYVVIVKTAPDKKIINKEHPHGTDKEGALAHLSRLEKLGWKAEIELREENIYACPKCGNILFGLEKETDYGVEDITQAYVCGNCNTGFDLSFKAVSKELG